MADPISLTFDTKANADRIVFDGSEILSQIPPSVREKAFLDRPSDVRLLVITEKMGDAFKHVEFPNHGHPDNEMSNVDFNGENGIMIMPAGTGQREQLDNAQKVIDALAGAKVTPAFIRSMITPKDAPLHGAVKEIYGPVTGRAGVEAQVGRFVAASVAQADGSIISVEPQVTNNYAMGMRASTKEEVYKLDFETALPFTVVGDEYKETRKAYLKGNGTAEEKMDPALIIQDGIYLVVDAAAGITKPLKNSVAEAIFGNQSAISLNVDVSGIVRTATLPLPLLREQPTPKNEPAPAV